VKQLVLVAALATLIGCSAATGYPKRPAGPVLDLADILPEKDEAALNQRLTDYWRQSGNAIVVVSVKSLEGQTIEKYAFGLFNDWGIGDAKTNRGLLVLVAPAERKVRIEVGCGLEGRIPDALAEQIIETKMIPDYKRNDLEAGTVAGVDALIDYLQSPAAANDDGPHTATCRAQMKGKAA
jgi:uncharacterized protein